MRRLVVILSGEPPTSRSQDTLLFNRLLELELNAEREVAAEASYRVIARIRRIAGDAAPKEYQPFVPGH